MGVWFLMGIFGTGTIEPVIWASAFNGLLVAGYTAFLFGQAEGRDLWQTPLLLWHMIGGGLAVGGGVSLIAAYGLGSGDDLAAPFAAVMVTGSIIVGLMTLSELTSSHPTTNASAAYHHMTSGEFAQEWWWGQVLVVPIPIVAGLVVLVVAAPVIGVVGALAAMAGVFLADDAFVKAGQSVPLS